MTNKSPYGSYRGWGQLKANLIHERLVEALARKLGMRSNEVRYKNFVAPDSFPSPARSSTTTADGTPTA